MSAREGSSDKVSDNRHGQRRTPADIRGRSVAGQACCGAGSLGRYLASGRRGRLHCRIWPFVYQGGALGAARGSAPALGLCLGRPGWLGAGLSACALPGAARGTEGKRDDAATNSLYTGPNWVRLATSYDYPDSRRTGLARTPGIVVRLDAQTTSLSLRIIKTYERYTAWHHRLGNWCCDCSNNIDLGYEISTQAKSARYDFACHRGDDPSRTS